MRSYEENRNRSYEIVPFNLITEQRIYETTRDNVIFNSLEEQFPKGSEVIILKTANEKKSYQIGAKAQVVGHNQEVNNVRVRITK